MAYSAGNKTLDDHYNLFVTGNENGSGNDAVANINSVLGVGSTDKGYGQTTTLPAVNAGSKITATQWANMLNRIDTLAAHQGSTVSGITNPTAGSTISAFTALQNDVNTVYNNRRNAAIQSGATTNGYIKLTASWTAISYPRILVQFPSADQMRYFFNAGGTIAFNVTRDGGTVTAKNTAWTDFCNECGTIVFSGGSGPATIAGTSYTGTTKIGGSGTVSTIKSDIGMYDLVFNGSWILLFQQFEDTAPYTANNITWHAKGGADGKSIDFAYNLVDDHPDGGSQDVIDGTITMNGECRLPSNTYLTTAWGLPTLTGRDSGQT